LVCTSERYISLINVIFFYKLTTDIQRYILSISLVYLVVLVSFR